MVFTVHFLLYSKNRGKWDQSLYYLFLFVWGLSFNSWIFHSYGDVTNTGEGLQILNYAQHSWPYMVKKLKLDTMIKVINLVNKNDWAISFDFKDAFLHVPIHQNHRKYFRFFIQGKPYQFKALYFDTTQAPRVFRKIVTTVAAYLPVQKHQASVIYRRLVENNFFYKRIYYLIERKCSICYCNYVL